MSDETKRGDGSPRGGAAASSAAGTPLPPPPRVSLPGGRGPPSAGPAGRSGAARDSDGGGGLLPTDAEVLPEDAIDPELARALRERDDEDSVAESIDIEAATSDRRRRRGRRPRSNIDLDALGIALDLPPSSPRVTAAGHASKFVMESEIPDDQIQGCDIILRREHYGAPGTAEHRKNAILVTTPLTEKFGVPRHKVISRASGRQERRPSQLPTHTEASCWRATPSYRRQAPCCCYGFWRDYKSAAP